MAITVHPETFKFSHSETYPNCTIDRHTVEVTINGDRRTMPAYKLWEDNPDREHITVTGLAVRFHSGSKVWPGSAVYWVKSGNVNNLRPDIDKRGHFTCVGFFEDFEGKAVQSQHNAVA